jgi:hypothetical protein
VQSGGGRQRRAASSYGGGGGVRRYCMPSTRSIDKLLWMSSGDESCSHGDPRLVHRMFLCAVNRYGTSDACSVRTLLHLPATSALMRVGRAVPLSPAVHSPPASAGTRAAPERRVRLSVQQLRWDALRDHGGGLVAVVADAVSLSHTAQRHRASTKFRVHQVRRTDLFKSVVI